jgi:hypothetical protein
VTHEDAQRRVHEAIGALLDDDEFALTWVLTVDVAGPEGRRYLAHRAGGGADGTESPMSWVVLGMTRASAALAEQQVFDCTLDSDDEPENE